MCDCRHFNPIPCQRIFPIPLAYLAHAMPCNQNNISTCKLKTSKALVYPPALSRMIMPSSPAFRYRQNTGHEDIAGNRTHWALSTGGQLSSYARCVPSDKISNGKSKGKGNTKNGNRYLAMAFTEAAHCASIWNPVIKRYYQRKSKKVPVMVAKNQWPIN